STQAVTTRSIVLAILAVAVGLGVVLVGLTLQQPVVGIGGFVVMLLGVLLAFRRGKPGKGKNATDGDSSDGAPASASTSNGVKGDAKRGATPSDGGFMDRLEDRWDRRRNGD
ncbi:MAG: hypothetical protein ACTH31_16060, partial [Pseudoclavibacter sp.]